MNVNLGERAKSLNGIQILTHIHMQTVSHRRWCFSRVAETEQVSKREPREQRDKDCLASFSLSYIEITPSSDVELTIRLFFGDFVYVYFRFCKIQNCNNGFCVVLNLFLQMYFAVLNFTVQHLLTRHSLFVQILARTSNRRRICDCCRCLCCRYST